jgi:hypothetical protein
LARTVGDIGMSRFTGLNGPLHFLFAGEAARVLLGHEDHAHAVLARRRKGDTLRSHLFAVQRVGQLNQQACTVAHEFVSAHCAPMIQVFKDLQALLHDGVTLFALDVCHESDTAGVVLMGRVVQTLLLEVVSLGGRGHGFSFFNRRHIKMRRMESIVQCNKNAKLFK